MVKMGQKSLVLHSFLFFSFISELKGVWVTLNVEEGGGVLTLQKAQTVSLVCEARDHERAEELEWYRDKALVRLEEQNKFNSSSLCVQSVSEADHRVTFSCQLRRDGSVNASVQLDVRFPPDLSGTETRTAEVGSAVALTCNIYANPQVSVTWLKNDATLNLEEDGYSLYQDGKEATLSIAKVQYSHQGTYRCEALSPQHGNSTKTFSLTVEDKKTHFPFEPVIAGVVVVLCTVFLATFSRRKRIAACCK
ncbi:transmembrane and immunoglobulin domain-containing protein 1 [Lepisosteus oculatus]|uniref:transmembrane and immunoglobulin domain-containing protein 1 n=1 Tax=Lepisosteus oculatus TaxID=7918 RepID=UPI00073FC725|nr:PREDICTED: transmembrane and immunoglobulin domain-containing protein 1 [Lepisosteus oculatus]